MLWQYRKDAATGRVWAGGRSTRWWQLLDQPQGRKNFSPQTAKFFLKQTKGFWKKVKKTNHAKHLNLMYPVKV